MAPRKRTGETMRRALIAGAALLGAVAGLAPALNAQEQYVLGGTDAAIYNLAGQVRLEPSEQGMIQVDLRRGGADAAQLRVETGEIDGRRTLRVVYPGSRIVYPELGRRSTTTLRVNRDGTFGGRAAGGPQVRIEGSGGGTEAFADLVVRVPRGARVAVYLAVGAVVAENVDGDLRLDTHGASVTATGTRGKLDIDVGSGAVRVSDAQGEILVDGGSSSVTVERIRATQLSIDVGSGGVTGSDIEVNRLNVDTGSGRVRLRGVGMVEGRVDTGSGGVELELTQPVRSLLVDTGSGGVRLSVPPTFGGELQVSTGSGGINVDLPVQVLQQRRSSFRGQIGEGDGRIRVSTGSGGVRVSGR
jgi:lia operon protein LiaG